MSQSHEYQSFLRARPDALCGEFNKVSGADFKALIISLRERYPVLTATLHLHDDYDRFDCRTGPAAAYGYAVSPEGELTNVFSCVSGGGVLIMQNVMRDYDRLHLNCFDHTEKFYAKHGFSAVRREANWAGGNEMALPDVVFMEWRKPDL
jgi:hypothetical protein